MIRCVSSFGTVRLKEVSIQKPKHTDKYHGNPKPNKYSYLNEIHNKHKMKSQQTDIPDVQEEYLIEDRGNVACTAHADCEQNH